MQRCQCPPLRALEEEGTRPRPLFVAADFFVLPSRTVHPAVPDQQPLPKRP